MSIEVRLGEETRSAGIAQDSPAKLESMKASLRTVDELVTAGLFSLNHAKEWQFETRYRSAEDWAEFVNKPNLGGIDADQDLLDVALSRPDGQIVLTEENLALSYERLAP